MYKLENDEYEELRKEVNRASGYYYYSKQQMGIDNKTKKYLIKDCEPHIQGTSVLELGYIDGIWTDLILEKGYTVDIIEGATCQSNHAKSKYNNNSNVRIYNMLFQEFVSEKKYNTILAADMIRYIPNPIEFLNNIKKWLKDDGTLIITVPNKRSLHKRVGTLMNIERIPGAQTLRDSEVGNLKSYDRYDLRDLLIKAGYKIKELRGCFLKPLSSEQMEEWDDEKLNAFYEIGKELEDYCWFIYGVCHK